MKKSLLFSLSALFALFFLSCASIPKTVNPGDTLVIGRVEITAHDYKRTNDVEINGTYYSEVELTLKDMISGSEKLIKPDENGCFYISGLKAHGTYGFTKVQFLAMANDGHGVKLWVDISQPRTFIPYDNQVVNIGCTYYDFNGAKNWVTWDVRNFFYVQECFNDLEDESEWFDKPIVEQR